MVNTSSSFVCTCPVVPFLHVIPKLVFSARFSGWWVSSQLWVIGAGTRPPLAGCWKIFPSSFVGLLLEPVLRIFFTISSSPLFSARSLVYFLHRARSLAAVRSRLPLIAIRPFWSFQTIRQQRVFAMLQFWMQSELAFCPKALRTSREAKGDTNGVREDQEMFFLVMQWSCYPTKNGFKNGGWPSMKVRCGWRSHNGVLWMERVVALETLSERGSEIGAVF